MNTKQIRNLIILDSIKTLFPWRNVVKELIAIACLWSNYLLLIILTTPLPGEEPTFSNDWKWLIPYAFWASVIGSAISFLIASAKSLLPVLIVAVLGPIFLATGIVSANILVVLICSAVCVHAVFHLFFNKA